MSNDHTSVASGNRHIAPFLPSNSQVTEESLRPAQMVLKSLNLLTPLLWFLRESMTLKLTTRVSKPPRPRACNCWCSNRYGLTSRWP